MPKNSIEVEKFMARERLASFATVTPNGEPHVVPVFFTYVDGKVYVQTDRNSVKAHNMLANDNVTVAVYSGEEAVIVRGKGRIVDRDEEFIGKTRDHVNKYRLRLDEQGRDSLGIPLYDREIRCVVEVTPKRVMFWWILNTLGSCIGFDPGGEGVCL